MFLNRILMLSVIWLFQSLCVAAEKPQWILVTDDDGIQVYTIEQKNTDIVKAKAVTEIKSPLIKIRQQLDDVDGRHEWVPFLKQSTVLNVKSETERIEYSLFSAPWPASDRDFVYSLELVNETPEQLIYKMHSVSSEKMLESEKIIRGEIFESIYTLTKLSKDVTRVELSYHADPKGWLPSWIVNIIQRVFPYKILRNLRIRLEMD